MRDLSAVSIAKACGGHSPVGVLRMSWGLGTEVGVRV